MKLVTIVTKDVISTDYIIVMKMQGNPSEKQVKEEIHKELINNFVKCIKIETVEENGELDFGDPDLNMENINLEETEDGQE